MAKAKKPASPAKRKPPKASLKPLERFLATVPAIDERMGSGWSGELWWVKFEIDTEHPLAWRVVQELGHVLNYLSTSERLPTVFMPVSPPPYMNGGVEFLSWVIESRTPGFTPATCAEWLHGRLPRPVTDLAQWNVDGDDEDDG